MFSLNIFISIFLLFLLYLLIFRYKAPWVPIFTRDLIRIDQLINLEAGKTFYDLGCGNGRVIFYLAKKYPSVNFVGVELSLNLFIICNLRKIFGGYKNVKLILNDYMRLDLNLADYIYVFANAGPIQTIGEKLARERKKALIVISYCFPINNLTKFLREKNKPDAKNQAIYIYDLK